MTIFRSGLDAVKIDAEGTALNILSHTEMMSCGMIVVVVYHFPMEEVRVSMRLRELGFEKQIRTDAGQYLQEAPPAIRACGFGLKRERRLRRFGTFRIGPQAHVYVS